MLSVGVLSAFSLVKWQRGALGLPVHAQILRSVASAVSACMPLHGELSGTHSAQGKG